VNDFDLTSGSAGSWFSDVVGKVLDYKTKTQTQQPIRWLPYGSDGTQLGIAPDGSLIQRGTPAQGLGAGALANFLPLALLAGVAFLLFRALK
jgi:hypothetical protein